jgi:hypothetical protein
VSDLDQNIDSGNKTDPGRKWMMWSILVLAVVCFIEGSAYLAARILLGYNLLIMPPEEEGYELYLESRDSDLGWPSPSWVGLGEFDVSGSRVVPAFPDASEESCIALFGDSFTWGDEVAAEFAYGNVLSQKLNCRVSNYGVGGYGTDQAVLRYVEKINDSAEVVVLGHFSENIIRNVNQLRDLTSGTQFGFKPRFVLNSDGEPKRIPLPLLSLDEYLALPERVETLLPYEYFVPNTYKGSAWFQFPYTIALGRSMAHYRLRGRLNQTPSYAPFYEKDHPSGALSVTTAVIALFVQEAKSRGQTPIVLLIPDSKDIQKLREGEPLPYDPLIKELKKLDIDPIDHSANMVASLSGRDICTLFVRCGSGSHYNEAGYALLADTLYKALSNRGLIPN